MKSVKRFISIFLSVALIFCSLCVISSASETVYDDDDSIILYVDGFSSTDIINYDTGDSLWPPEAKSIVKTIFSNLGSVTCGLIKGLFTGDYSDLTDPVYNIMDDLFGDFVMDSSGSPITNSGSVWTYDFVNEDEEYDYDYYFSYDWRLAVQDVAVLLHDYIEYILEQEDADSVSIIATSLGTCVLMSYLKIYDYEYVDGFVIHVGAYNGDILLSCICTGDIVLDADDLVRYIDCYLDRDTFSGMLISNLILRLNAIGLLDKICDLCNDILEDCYDDLSSTAFADTLALLPGIWTMIDYEYYEEAKEYIFGDTDIDEEYISLIDWYHYNVQIYNDEIIAEAMDRGLNVGIVCQYGLTNIPCTSTADYLADGVIDLINESYGATVGDATGTLGSDYVQAVDNGHDCLSADGYIDSSTCAFTDITWFVKNVVHNHVFSGDEYDLFEYILLSDEQVTVWDGVYDQFLIMIDDNLYTLTEENDVSLYDSDMSDETYFTLVGDYFSNVFSFIKNAF